MRIADLLTRLDHGAAPVDPGPAQAWLEGHDRRFDLFIDGAFTLTQDDVGLPTYNPATGDLLAHIAQADAADIDVAVAAARRAQAAWAALGGPGRAQHLRALAEVAAKKTPLFALLETLDTGAPIRDTRDTHLPRAIGHLKHQAGWADGAAFGDRPPQGVVALVLAGGHGLAALAAHLAPALAAGNTAVIKPAAAAPLTALLFAEVCRQAGLPPGVVNIVTGEDDGTDLAAHPGVDAVALAGPVETGRALRATTAGQGKTLTLALGGPAPFIVFDDADLDAAVDGVVEAAWSNRDACAGGVRLLMHAPIAAPLIAKLKARLTTLRVGDPLDPASDIAPLSAALDADRLTDLVADAVAHGATAHRTDVPQAAGAVLPTLVCDTAPAMALVQDAALGPVVPTLTFRTPAEAVALADNSRYGWAASLWTESQSLALDTARRLDVGTVWINATHLEDAAVSAGGRRESGFGRVGGHEGGWTYLAPAMPTARGVPDLATPKNGSAIPAAVEAAEKAAGWTALAPSARAQALRAWADGLTAGTAAAARLRAAASWAEAAAGATQPLGNRMTVLTLRDPLGIVGIVCPDAAPLLAPATLAALALAQGNRVVLVPSETDAGPTKELAQAAKTSGLPAGVLNIVPGPRADLVAPLAAHLAVDAVWCAAEQASGAWAACMEAASVGNLKRTWTVDGQAVDWDDDALWAGPDLTGHATQLKTVWLPHGA